MKNLHFFRWAFVSFALFSLMAVSQAQTEFEPFDIVEINFAVTDFDTWKVSFYADSVNRQASGLSLIAIGRELEKPNNLSLVFAIADLAKAKAFVADPRLKALMDKNGVISKPEISYFHVLRLNPESTGDKPWVVIKSKIKNYDAWLKVFDTEGAGKRASEGSQDIAVARGIEDPNYLFLVMGINDMAAFKTAISSEAKKALMTSAGVDGPPVVVFYSAGE